MPSHPLNNFEIQKYYQNEPRFKVVYSRDNLPKTKDGAYVIYLDEYSILELIGLPCMYEIMMWLILIVLKLNMFHKKLKHLLAIKT